MGAIRKKISELTPSTAFNGLWTIGVDALNRSVRVSLQYIADTIASLKSGVETAINNADKAATTANNSAKEADKQAGRAKEQADNPPKMGENGNWWKWDETAKKYVDTGILAKGGVLYPSFIVDDSNMHLVMYYQDQIAENQFILDKETGHLKFIYQ
ncbi:hypothetical protein EEK90_06845 [Muribaculaceae bacterium Isolate-036 (Harlan)]|nr:hypothetical protein EEK90_06845 [Muribaculaceae bacterium Isolate-036 (Harlan)]